jgi:hypothetical protein
MNELFNLIEYAFKNDIKRTIVNFRFSIDKNIYAEAYRNLQKNIIKYNTYNKLKISNIKDIYEIRCCFKNKNIMNMSFINPEIYNLDNDNKINKNYIQLNIIKQNQNTDKLKYHLENCHTSFDSYIKKKREKKKTLIKLFNNNKFNTICSRSTRYYVMESEYHQEISQIKIKYRIILEIYKEKIITEGRLLLPNSISITLKNRSRVIFYDNNKIQIILSKLNYENIYDFKDSCTYILNICYSIIHLYSGYKIDINSITTVHIHCDFNYHNIMFKYPIFFKNNKIRFFGKNRINIRSISSCSDLVNINQYINDKKDELLKLYKEIEYCNPFSDDISNIKHIIIKIYNF